jgi:hypothetical protein
LDYFNRYAEYKTCRWQWQLYLGWGSLKTLKRILDFPLAEANLTFTASKHIFELGYGRNFIGDGYRSLLESDGASPYPYFKINTNF